MHRSHFDEQSQKDVMQWLARLRHEHQISN